MRNLSTWDPFRDLINLQNRINRVFNDTARSASPEGEERFDSGSWTPVVDIKETGDSFEIKADVPGMKKEDISIDIGDNTLTIRGERKFEGEGSNNDYIRVERPYGVFSRSFALPQNVDSQNIKAKYKNGILELVLPKKEEAKPKKINIEVS